MTNYTVGIDTGGTYTDAVIIDAQKRQVIASAKALTTRGELSIGVTEALQKALTAAGSDFVRADIALVCLSTTLATNALVEGHGSSVAAVLIGFDDNMTKRTAINEAIPSALIVRVAGGHTYNGQEQAPLDEAAIRTALQGAAGKVAAYSVSAHYAVRNPSHEHQAEALIRGLTGCPVTASSDLSDALNGPRRALTATFNARIISLIVGLEAAVRSGLARLGIDASIMIVKGDGSIASAESVIAKPIETILSGPAASVIGARFLSGLSDFVIADIGGTTSDVATVRNGWPSLTEQGSDVGGFRTLVQAIDMQTVGLGGDSEVEVDYKGIVSVRANRVVPISLVAHQFPAVEKGLVQALGKQSGMLSATSYVFRPTGAKADDFPDDLSKADHEFLERIDGPTPRLYGEVIYSAGDRPRINRLVKQGVLQISGFTPSDAAHVLGLQSQWSAQAARRACELVGRAGGKVSGTDIDEQVNGFAREVHDVVVAKSARLLIERLSGCKFAPDDPLIDSVTSGDGQRGDILISLRPTIPVVAVGGPAAVFYPEVGRRLGCEVVIPTGSEVANAIGAATGMIKVRAAIEITSSDSGGYLVHGDEAPVFFASPHEALVNAEELARAAAQANARAMGGEAVSTEVQVARVDIPNMNSDASLIAATITAECISTPAAA